jgi:Protein of unknown function (DUF4043)
MYTVDFSSNYPIVQAKNAMLQAPNFMSWGKFMSWNTPGKKAVNPSGGIEASPVKNAPIVIQRELSKKAGTKIEIPIFRRLINLPKLGNQQLSGTGERPKINFAAVWIDEDRHAVLTREGNLSYQVMKEYGIPEWAKGALQTHYAEWCNFAEIPSAVYKGLSYNVLNSGIFANDANVAVRPHPHIYIAGGSKVGYSGGYPGTSGYASAVATAINAVGNTHVLTGSLLRALNADDQIRRIPYLTTKDNVPYRILLLHPYGMAQLRNDEDLKKLFNSVFVQQMAKENPTLTGMQLFYEGWAIFDFGNAIWPVSSDGSTTTWGPTITNLTSFNSYSSSDKFAAIILGDNALFQATGWDMRWTGETRDHNHIEEIGYTLGFGFSRGDFWNRDDGTTGQYVINDGSALLIHYAEVPKLA